MRPPRRPTGRTTAEWTPDDLVLWAPSASTRTPVGGTLLLSEPEAARIDTTTTSRRWRSTIAAAVLTAALLAVPGLAAQRSADAWQAEAAAASLRAETVQIELRGAIADRDALDRRVSAARRAVDGDAVTASVQRCLEHRSKVDAAVAALTPGAADLVASFDQLKVIAAEAGATCAVAAGDLSGMAATYEGMAAR